MTTVAPAELWTVPQRLRDPLLGLAGLLMLALVAAFARHGGGAKTLSPWMMVHLATILPAVPLGAIVLLRRKGGRVHRILGRVWVGLMMVGALASFGVRELSGHLSPIHLLSILTLISLPISVIRARAGRIAAHRRGMVIVYTALIIAGFFTLLPNRLLGGWLFGATA
jgi:uncharacterized membrane protein